MYRHVDVLGCCYRVRAKRPRALSSFSGQGAHIALGLDHSAEARAILLNNSDSIIVTAIIAIIVTIVT